jgi:ABC-type nitrate/sulfonate/bicarbonate transport system substrate-binding protein
MDNIRNRAMNSFGRLLAIASSIVVLTYVGAPAHAADKVKVTYPTLTSSYIFFFSAISKGYYKDEGLDLDVIESAGGVATPALVSGDVQFSTSGSSAISAMMKGAKLKVLMVGEDRPSWQIWSTRPEIKTFQDLKGQQIGVLSRGDTGEVAIRYVLEKNHLPQDFVSYTPMGSSLGTRMAVVRSGSLPAAVLQPAEVETLRASGAFGNAHMVMDLAEEVRSTFNGLATSDDMMKKQPDVVTRFVRATRKGMIYARDNRDGAIDVFVKVMKAQPDAAAHGYDELRKVMAQDATISPEAQTNELALRGAMLSMAANQVPPTSAVFDFSVVEKVNAELKASGWKPGS